MPTCQYRLRMELSELDLSCLSEDEFNTLFEKARKRCNSDILQDILCEVCKIMSEPQNRHESIKF